MPNIHLIAKSQTLLREQLVSLSSKMKALLQNGSIQTVEGLSNEANKLLVDLERQMGLGPIFRINRRLPNERAKAVLENDETAAIREDLFVLFSEFEALEAIAVGNFNALLSKSARLRRRLQLIGSRVADLSLYISNARQDALFFSDTFSVLDKVDIDTKLYSQELCEIDTTQGIVTLPIDKAAQKSILITKLPVINSRSNGSPGNNHELGSLLRGDSREIVDNNPDTWFEYERVVAQEDATPLILDISLVLDNPEVVNFIHVYPNHFGTRTQVKIETIETSLDGQIFSSIQEDMLHDTEGGAFVLAPSSSKFSGQGFFSFLPRKTKMIHLVFRQDTSYAIQTSSGTKLRYAIGIRGIQIEARPYKTQGELISARYTTSEEIKKVLLETEQLPGEDSPLSSIEHFVSPDDGNSWIPIQPKDFIGPTGAAAIREIVSFNTADANQIATPEPVKGLRYRALCARKDEAFQDESRDILHGARRRSSDIIDVPSSSNLTVALSKIPIAGSIQVVDPRLGSRGRRHHAYKVFPSTAGGSEHPITIDLPFRDIPLELDKSGGSLTQTNPVRVYVDGVAWTRGNINTITGTPENRQVFAVDLANGRVLFGQRAVSDADPGGLTPRGTISIDLVEERLYPDSPKICKLKYPTTGDKKEFELYVEGEIVTDTVLLVKGATIHRLKPNITSIASSSFSNSTIFSSQETFVDGVVELSDAGDWSVDLENGIVYSRSTTPTTSDVTVQYSYRPRERVADSAYDFQVEEGIVTGIAIKEEAFSYNEILSEAIATSVRQISLGRVALVKGSLVFRGGGVPNPLETEIPFIDGIKEFALVTPVSLAIPVLTGGTTSIPLLPAISTDTAYPAIFSNTTIFATAQASVVAVDDGPVGSYFIDRTNSRIYAKTAAAAVPGTINYYYDNPLHTSANIVGNYSVDYEKGILYTATTTTSGWVVDYKYTRYFARYNIARLLEKEAFEVDTTRGQIKFKSSELLFAGKLPLAGGEKKIYNVSYDMIEEGNQALLDLGPFFSPLLGSYKLKAMTASRLLGG